MAGNPRKFSEKIAIHQRKLNEEKNAFQSIMSEISGITNRSVDPSPQQWGVPGTSTQMDLYVPAPPAGVCSSRSDDSVVSRLQQQQPGGGQGHGQGQGHTPRGRSPGGGAGHGHYTHTYHPYRNVSPNQQHASATAGYTSVVAGGAERPQMTPSYPAAPMFLVPPQDTSWRRTHSDPGIHASVMQPTIPGGGGMHVVGGPSPQHNSQIPDRGNVQQQQPAAGYYLEPKLNPAQYRPRSCDNVPNISIQTSEPVAGPQVPISSNTGSLPDLPSTFLPTQAHLQQLEGVLNKVPLYAQVGGGMDVGAPAGIGMVDPDQGQGPAGAPGAGLMHLQQRHSIQLPVQYSRGYFTTAAGGSGGGMESMMVSQGSSSCYQTDSPKSSPNSPNDRATTGGSDDSQTSPVSPQPQSPGSPYCTSALRTKMQNVNIGLHEPFGSQQQPQHNTCYTALSSSQQDVSNSMLPSTATTTISNAYHQQEYAPSQHMASLQDQYQQQMYQALLFQHQQHPPPYSTSSAGLSAAQEHRQRMPAQIPDIIFTGADGSTSAGVGAGPSLIDPTVELLSSDLRVSLDPVDLESLHGLNSEQGLNIDAASEDALRHDRA